MSGYKFTIVPARGRKGRGGADGADLSAEAMQAEIDARAMVGWEYVGREVLVERRRFLLFLMKVERQTYLIFRRPLNRQQAAGATGTPRRAMRLQDPAEVALRRPREMDLIERVKAGGRRIAIRGSDAVAGSRAAG